MPARRPIPESFGARLSSMRRHAENLPLEIEGLASGKTRVIWDDGEDITEEVLANKNWELHCLRQLIEIAEEDAQADALQIAGEATFH
jgi:hypothetical protein